MGKNDSPDPPKPPPVVAPVTNEDDNVKDAAQRERKRIYGQEGRKSTSLLDSSIESAQTKKDLLG